MEQVFSGIKVLDLTAGLPGAVCTMHLGDCGAYCAGQTFGQIQHFNAAENLFHISHLLR